MNIKELTLVIHSMMKTYNLLHPHFSDSYIIVRINEILTSYLSKSDEEMLIRLGLDDTDLNRPNEFDNMRFEGE